MVFVLLGAVLAAPPLFAQSTTEITPLGRDEAAQLDRYQVTLGPGATLWDLATEHLPLVALDEGEERAYSLVLESFQRSLPDHSPDTLQPGERFVLEVPAGAFVAAAVTRENGALVYRSFHGDQLTYYPRHPALLYRLVWHDRPEQVEVKLSARDGDPVDLARAVYEVDPPDFIQVRTVRAALSGAVQRLVVNAQRRYLDDFRNFRDRAVEVKASENGRTIYRFDPTDRDNPFLYVEDAVGDQHDPTQFPHEFRLAIYRDGTVRRYLLTEPGDTLGQWSAPDDERWRTILPAVSGWQRGRVESLPPFAPAVDASGKLLPGRLLVLRFSPRADAPSRASGLTCAGMPLVLVFIGLALRRGSAPAWNRRRHDDRRGDSATAARSERTPPRRQLAASGNRASLGESLLRALAPARALR